VVRADRLDIAVPDQGMHLVSYPRNGSSDITISAAGQRAGIVVRAIGQFYRAPRAAASCLGSADFRGS
jgi:hypothetical protein